MIILSILSLFLTYSSTSHTYVHTACNELTEVIADAATGAKTYCNRYKIPVVDANGKMMFKINVQRRGSQSHLNLEPAMSCHIIPQSPVTITFVDGTEHVSMSESTQSNQKLNVSIDAALRSKMMTSKILSIDFAGKKYQYNVVLKPNQGRVVQDVLNCIQPKH